MVVFALALSCSSASLSSPDAARDASHAGSDVRHDAADVQMDTTTDTQPDVLGDAPADSRCTGGQILVYGAPGCGASAPTPVCAGPTFDACFIPACGCDGQLLGGCGQYTEPFAHPGACDDGGSTF